MVFSEVKKKVIYPVIFLSSLTVGILATELGLNAILSTLKYCLPGQLTYESAKGTLIQGSTLTNISYLLKEETITVKDLSFDFSILWQQQYGLSIPAFSINDLVIDSTKTKLQFNQIQGQLKWLLKSNVTNLKIFHITALIREQVLQGSIEAQIQKQKFTILNAALKYNQSKFNVKNNTNYDISHFNLDLNEPSIKAQAQGQFNHMPKANWQMKLKSAALQFKAQDLPNWKLSKPSLIALSTKQVKFEPMHWQATDNTARSTISALWSTPKDWQTKLLIDQLDLAALKTSLGPHTQIKGLAKLELNLYGNANEPINGRLDAEILPGDLLYAPGNSNFAKSFPYKGGKLYLGLKKQDIEINLNILGPNDTQALGQFLITQAFKQTDLLLSPVQGTLSLQTKELSWLNNWIKDFSDFKAGLVANFKVNGTLIDPEVKADVDIYNLSFSLPKPNILVHHGSIKFQHLGKGEISFKGQGESGQGFVETTGQANLFNLNAPISFNVVGKNFLISNTRSIQINASPTLQGTLSNLNTLKIAGEINIPEANVNLQDEMQQTVLTHDVTFIDSKAEQDNQTRLKIEPDILLKINKKISLKGYGLDAGLAGEIRIERFNKGFLFGNGHLTIQEGKYRLNGRHLFINHGRLTFQSASLLSNPSIDIKLVPKEKGQLSVKGHEFGLYIQGTLKNPTVYPFSDETLTDAEIFNRLGFQSAFMVLSNLVPNEGKGVLEQLQDKTGVEFDISQKTNTTSSAGSDLESNTSSNDQYVFTLTKHLTNKFMLQLQSEISGHQDSEEDPSLVRLNYALNPYWSLALEQKFNSFTNGSGAEISYVIERD